MLPSLPLISIRRPPICFHAASFPRRGRCPDRDILHSSGCSRRLGAAGEVTIGRPDRADAA